MANNKMLIDATHPEETRVVVLRGGRVEEFDYESAARKQLRGNIYLAKVTRVEPSLQAAFVDYGGNRHGFLAFNEIHPDYYQIPMADRQALLDEEAAAEAEEEAAADARAERLARRRQRSQESSGELGDTGDGTGDQSQGDDRASYDGEEDDDGEGEDDDRADHDDGAQDDEAHQDVSDRAEPQTIAEASMASDETIVEDLAEPEPAGGFEPEVEVAVEHEASEAEAAERSSEDASDAGGARAESVQDAGAEEAGGVHVIAAPSADAEAVEQVGSEDALEELPSRPRRRPRSYKIQEVIKRRQVILVQVVKEERGNKGAALTTYLSLAGRYTVLMPNTARGGGISRKITNPQDRKRLKAIAQELEVPEGMGLIIRTAGAARTKQEIKRDFEYLLRLWESVRDLTLESTAPSLVYEEGNLIKRSIRDLYNKDVEEVIVAGDQAFKEAKDFMRMLMPSHAKNVLSHQDPEPLFTKYGIERQLNAMFSPYVTLKSGGYLVINQTEALVAIDVNSGKATREFSIEETALNTNLEASDEIARQLKLRDLAGLVVIDYIDMEEKRNNRSVERRLKDALRFDRARIQLGRISHFGLMEMSRQRLRTGVLEGSTAQCPHCQGTGIIRSTESVALAVLRGLEDALMAGARTSLVATTTPSVALYILNNKRAFINEMEARHGIFIAVQASDKLQGANFQIEKGHAAPVAARRPERTAVNMDWGFEGEGDASEPQEGGEASVTFVEDVEDDDRPNDREARGGRDEGRDVREGREEGGRRRRRRRGRRGGTGGGEGDRHDGRQDERRAEGQANGHTRNIPGDGPQPSYSRNDDWSGDAERDVSDDQIGDEDGGPEAAGSSEPRQGGNRQEGGGRSEEGGGRRRRRGRRGGRRGRERSRLPNATNEGVPIEAGAEGAAHDDHDDHEHHHDGDHGQEVEAGFDAAKVAAMEPGEALVPAAEQERRPAAMERPSRRAPAPVPQPVAQQPPQPVAEQPEVTPEVSTAQPAATEVQPAHVEPAASTVRPRARTRNQSTATEPKLERVVIAPDHVDAIEGEASSGEPVRRGWWQRRLGGQ